LFNLQLYKKKPKHHKIRAYSSYNIKAEFLKTEKKEIKGLI